MASLPMRWPFLFTTTAPGSPRYMAQSVPAISWAIVPLSISSCGSCPVVRMAGAPQQESMNDTSAPMAMPILWPSPVLVSARVRGEDLEGHVLRPHLVVMVEPAVARMTASALTATSSLPDVALTPTTAPSNR